MIAVAGLQRLRAGEHAGAGIEVRARWPLEELRVPGSIATKLP
jgi:tRNA A37 threonylcarbamoyltransferase TsaD